MSPPKLKLGLFVDSFKVPAWIFRALERIANAEYAEFSVILINGVESRSVPESSFEKLWKHKKKLVYQFLNKIDEKAFFREPDAFEEKDIQELLSDIPHLSIKTVSDEHANAVIWEGLEKVRVLNLDIIVAAGTQRLEGDIVSVAKYGVWFYNHGDNRVTRGGPSGFWEVVEKLPETGAVLSMADACSPNGRAVYRSRFLTHPFSPARNRNISFWASSSFLPRQIEFLHRYGETRFLEETDKLNTGFDFYSHKPYKTPSNLSSVRLYALLFLRVLNGVYQRIFCQDRWHLMFDLTKSSSLSFNNFKEILPPKGRFWADPHVIRREGKFYIFVEEYPYETFKGHISVIEMDEQGQYKDAVPVLKEDYHLSYPFVFEHKGKYFMIPESAQNNSIDLYECIDFPNRWEYKMCLMDKVKAVDTTLFFHAGKWWLFTGLAENEGAFPEVELFLFHSDDLFTTQWIPHPLNPVISDVTRARPAGSLFIKDEKLYRPSQDCSKIYGHGFNLNEVVCLTETEYIEEKIVAVKPDWDSKLRGTHTYTNVDGLVIIDVWSTIGKFV